MLATHVIDFLWDVPVVGYRAGQIPKQSGPRVTEVWHTKIAKCLDLGRQLLNESTGRGGRLGSKECITCTAPGFSF